MKKFLLIFALVPLLAHADENNVKVVNGTPNSTIIKNFRNIKNAEISFPTKKAYKKQSGLYVRTVGKTTYDLGTNASLGRKIVNNNGKISFTWTWSIEETSNFPDRGSNYNFWDGTKFTGALTQRLESSRAGFSVITSGNSGDGNDQTFIVSHSASANTTQDTLTSGGMFVLKNASVGSSVWKEKKYKNPNGPMWPRAIGSNGFVHIIGTYQNLSKGGTKKINGISAPLTYSRYNINKDSFDIQDLILPGYDTSSYVYFGSADDYSIDARGTNVSILTGRTLIDLVLWKSSDNGKNWTKHILVDNPNTPYQSSKNKTFDTMLTANGSCHVVIDNKNVSHSFFSGLLVLKQTKDTGGSYTYFPNSEGIYYIKDTNSNRIRRVGTFPVPDGFDSATVINNVLPGNKAGAPTGGTNTCLYMTQPYSIWPNVAIDAKNNFYLFYSSVNVSRSTLDGNQNFRDIYYTTSSDEGSTWKPIKQLTSQKVGGSDSEYVYPSVARDADSNVHIMWMKDDEPGTNLTNSDPVNQNIMEYGSIYTDDLLAGNIQVIGIAENNQPLAAISNVYPNPAFDKVYTNITLTRTADVTISLYDISGRFISSKNFGKIPSGLNSLKFDVNNVNSGLYILKYSVDGQTSSKTLNINR